MVFSVFQMVAVNEFNFGSQILFYSSFIIGILILTKVIRTYRSRLIIPAFDSSKGHNWSMIDILSNSVYCNICKGIIMDGMCCDSCGICSDNACYKKADTEMNCKASSSDNVFQKHHWICGNLDLYSFCMVCGEECSLDEILVDYRCCWCQRTVHEKEQCFSLVSNVQCDFGIYQPYIIPPYSVKVKSVWFKSKNRPVVQSINNLKPTENWKPLIVVANRKSGSSEGIKILQTFRYILNSIQVIDVSESSLKKGLEICRLISQTHIDVRVRILVAGGDGTIAWVLETLNNLKIEPQPLVALLPIGTGNDLSRVLGWGAHFTTDFSIESLLKRISDSNIVMLDRWKVKVAPPLFGLSFASKKLFMNNYLSIGVDALVSLKFHQTRESKLINIFGSRLLNQFLYLSYATKDVLERKCRQLNQKIILKLNGIVQELPDLESILLLNIPSWGGGTNIWPLGSKSDTPEQKIDDRLLEVVGLYSSLHIGQMMIGLSEPYRFGQAEFVEIKLMDRLPIQIDGEPWLQGPSNITISWHSQSHMLKAENE